MKSRTRRSTRPKTATRISAPREGWAEAAERLAARGENVLLAEPASTRFDREDWKW